MNTLASCKRQTHSKREELHNAVQYVRNEFNWYDRCILPHVIVSVIVKGCKVAVGLQKTNITVAEEERYV